MSARSVCRFPLLALTMLAVSLVTAGVVLTLVLVIQWISPYWSRVALLLQGCALLLAGVSYRRRPSWRLLLYPIVLGSSIYLWDSTLPPPSLPEGPIRVGLPMAILAGIMLDVGLMLWQTAWPPGRVLHAHAGRVVLMEVAPIAGLSPEALRTRCLNIGVSIITESTGVEYLWLSDVLTRIIPPQRRAALFVRADAQPHLLAVPIRLEVLRWPIGIIWWLAIGVMSIVHLTLNMALPQFQSSFTNVMVLLSIGLIMALLWLLGTLRVTLDSVALRIRLGPLQERIALARIVACQVTTYDWQAWGGYGHHRRRRERLYNVPGDAGVAVEILLDTGRRVLFSAHHPRMTCEIVRAAAMRARQQPVSLL